MEHVAAVKEKTDMGVSVTKACQQLQIDRNAYYNFLRSKAYRELQAA